MPSVKWESAELTGFKVYKWNERLIRKNIPEDEGLFIFRRHDGVIKRVIRFNLFTMINRVPDPNTGRFSPFNDGIVFTNVLSKSKLFDPANLTRLVTELTSFLGAFFEFSSSTVNSPNSPRLIFVVDFSYNPFLHYPPTRTPLDESEEDEALDMYESDVTDDNEDEDEDEVELRWVPMRDGDDVEDGYTDEMEEIVKSLRVYRGVERMHPMKGWSEGERIGLVQVELPLVEMLEETAPFDCPVCMNPMEENEPVLKTKCGRLLHKTCSLTWLSPNVKCPICQLCEPALL